ncbi:MAG TPA: amino acid adenylation domain-containing protein [Nitrospirae bacterium]|nr:amino acid adenylation domain-containing protein [Nitrospirota bacterium]
MALLKRDSKKDYKAWMRSLHYIKTRFIRQMPELSLFTKEATEQSIPSRYEEQEKLFPERIAVKYKDGVLTYKDLNISANRIAHAILKQGGDTNEQVAFIAEHGSAPIVALLGILKAGKIYVPLDPSFPHDMLKYILRDSQAGIIVTNNANSDQAATLAQDNLKTINMDGVDDGLSVSNPEVEISPYAIANILYTSGSTGKPKGVMQNHRNVLHSVMSATNIYHINNGDRISLLLSPGFAASMIPMFGALLNGAALLPFNLKTDGISNLLNWMKKEDVTIFYSVSSLFRHLLSVLTGEEGFSYLRLIVVGGEPVYRRDVELYKRLFSESCELIVRLASTETHMIRCLKINKRTAIKDNMVPVGFAVEDKDVAILNDSGEEANVNEIGEIVVTSRYLSPGYWGMPDLTERVFMSDPHDKEKRVYRTGDLGRMGPEGCLQYLGRKDDMVKIRGHRVETGEIETAILEMTDVKEVTVVSREDTRGNKYLVAYIVPLKARVPTDKKLRDTLKKRLPDYMIPPFYIPVESLPHTPTGKIDRQALPEPVFARPKLMNSYVAPRDEVELKLVTICEDISGINPVGVRDDLYDLGMDSLQYLTFFIAGEQGLGKKISSDVLPRMSTIEEFAVFFRGGHPSSSIPLSERHAMKRHFPLSRHKMFNFFDSAGSTMRKAIRYSRYFLVKTGGALIPYSVGSVLLSWFCNQGFAQEVLYRSNADLVNRFLPLIGAQEKTADIIRQNIILNCFADWRYASLSRMTGRRWEKWITVTGTSALEEAYRNGRGVVLISSHDIYGAFVLRVLLKRGFRNIVVLADIPSNEPCILGLLGLKDRRDLSLQNISWDEVSQEKLAGYLHKSRHVLERGGIVNLAADGYLGDSGISLPLHGRIRSFKAGFAGLAVNTGAAAIPVSVTMNTTGHVKVAFMDQLEYDYPHLSNQEKIEELIKQYVCLLEKRWTEEPGNIALDYIRRFPLFPEVH